jgi:hypothetical protein
VDPEAKQEEAVLDLGTEDGVVSVPLSVKARDYRVIVVGQ